DRHALLDDPLHAQQAHPERVLDQLADRANAAVAEVVDVVRMADAVVQLDHHGDDLDEVFLGQDPLNLGNLEVEAAVDLVAADLTEVVAAEVEEERVDQVAGVLDRRRVTGTQASVELEQRVLGALGRI